MKKIISLCILLSCAGCKSNKQTGLKYYNDFESIKGWTEVLLEKKPVHSGIYSNRLDTVNRYGETFKLTFKEISDRLLKKAKVSFWVFLPDAMSKAKLVMQIDQPDKKNLFWTAKNIEDFVKTPGQWTEVKFEFSFVNKDFLLPQNIIKIYSWNIGKDKIFIDDIRIEFVL
jgi:hypothetical protein